MRVQPKLKKAKDGQGDLNKTEKICRLIAIIISAASVYYFFIKLVFL